MEETISLKEIFSVLKKRLILIIILMIGAALISGLVTRYAITPTYQASNQFIVNQSRDQADTSVDLNQIRSNVEIINTYNIIMKSNYILDQVVSQLDLTISSGSLSDKLSVRNEGDSQVVTVTATDPDPAMAVAIANTTVEIFQNDIGDLMHVDNVNVLAEAKLAANPSPVSPNLTLNVAIALVLGAMVGVGLAFLLEFLDTSVKTEEDVENKLELPVLGVISHISDRDIVIPHQMNRTRERGAYSGQTKKTS